MKPKIKTVKNDSRDIAPKHGGFPVVGIGASAGGIEALKIFFSAVPAEPGMAFVVIVHLSQEHESHLAEIIQNQTAMRVVQVSGTATVEPNNVYVIPPAKGLALSDGIIKLTEPTRIKGKRVPIDLFFRTLADAYGEHGIAVILSGTGSDGTLGLKRVKEHGGIGIAQEPAEAAHDGMPRNAINTGLVDLVLPVAQIPEKLIHLQRNGGRIRLPVDQESEPVDTKGKDGDPLREILRIVRVRTGHDFSNYKHATVLRRIARRMQVHGISGLEDYLEYLRRAPEEGEVLQRDLLITVTNFFRDKESWETIEKQIVPKLFAGKRSGDTIRVWSVGCATGEEAYSLAILLDEGASKIPDPPTIQIFASDINDEAIRTARECFYEETIVADVSPERLRRYFTKESGGFRLRKELREMVLFAPHNILRDPPFSRIDLISCRNLMIYLNRETQGKVFGIFNFALRPEGYLFLGGSESAESASAHFAVIDKKRRIYKARPGTHYRPLPSMPSTGKWNVPVSRLPIEALREKAFSFGELHYNVVEQFAPPSVLIDDEYEIVHVSENAGRFLNVAGGEPSRNLLKLVHPALKLDLQSALYQVKNHGHVSESRNVQFPLNKDRTKHESSENEADDEILVNLTVRFVKPPDSGSAFYLVVFDESRTLAAPLGAGQRPDTVVAADAVDNIVRKLEEELTSSRERLRTTIELHETSHEELKASNEELQALNEELRSASEELETSKEELQSLNEELMTLNAELREKVEEAAVVNSDLRNLIQSTDIGTIFLDRALRLRRYTPRVADLFNIIPSDIGRPFEHLTHKLDHDHLVEDAREVIRSLRLRELEVRGGNDDKRYLLRLAPYRTIDDKIDGVVLSFQDITELKRSGDLLLESEEQYRAIVNQNLAGIGKLDLKGNIAFANDKFCEMLGHGCGELAGTPIAELIYPQDLPVLLDLVERLRNDGAPFEIEKRFVRSDGLVTWIHLGASPLKDSRGNLHATAVVLIDVTERKRAEEAFRKSEEGLRLMAESFTDYAIFMSDLDGNVLTWNTGAERIFGYTDEEIIGTSADKLFTPEDREAGVPDGEMETARTKGRAADERWHIRKDGSRFYASGVMAPLFDEGALVGYAKIARDLTEAKKMEEELHQYRNQLEMLVVGRTAELEQSNFTLRQEMSDRQRSEEARIELLRRIVTTQEDERRRIARDMHDQLGQQSTALRLKIASLADEKSMSPRLSREIEGLQEYAANLDAQIGFLAWELRPAALDDLGFVAAVRNFVSQWSRHYQILADFHARDLDSLRLAREVETHLYRITQEALNNVYKHANAKSVNVVVERRKDEIVLIIEDDGVGFDPADLEPNREFGSPLGLIGMRERAAIVGGTIEIESSPGKGTTVFVRVPIIRERIRDAGNNKDPIS